MEISARPLPIIGLRSAKHEAKLDAQRDVVQQADAHQADALQVEDVTPGAEVQRFLQATDEMAAAATQFRNRRDYDKKLGHLAESFERVLEEEAQPKAQKLVQVGRSLEIPADDLLRQARAMFPDESDLALVLREMLRRRELDEVVRKRLEILLQQVEEQAEPKKLKAGINCALKARLFGKALMMNPAVLRASYRQFLMSDTEAVVDTYADWISSYGYQRRAKVLDFIEDSVVTDIDAQEPSCSQLEFGYLLGRLSQLKLLRSADLRFVSGLLADPVVCSFNGNEADWLVVMMSLFQQAPDLDLLLADTVGRSALLSRHREHSLLLQALFSACRELPPSLFAFEGWYEELLDSLRHLAGIAMRHELPETRRAAEGG